MMPRVLDMDELRAILGTAQGKTLRDVRDNALLRVLFDSGARRHEIAALRYSPTDPDDRDVDLRRGLVHVLGKGGKDNYIALLEPDRLAIEDYLRAVASIPMLTSRGCGWDAAAGSPTPASRSCSETVAPASASPACMPMTSATPPPIRAGRRHERGRRHEQAGLGLPRDAAEVREHDREREGHRGEPPPGARRQAMTRRGDELQAELDAARAREELADCPSQRDTRGARPIPGLVRAAVGRSHGATRICVLELSAVLEERGPHEARPDPGQPAAWRGDAAEGAGGRGCRRSIAETAMDLDMST